jgi:hypothetical protein
MATQTLTKTKQNQTVEDRVKHLRQLFADAPQYAKTALENSLKDLTSFASKPRARVESAGRTGIRQGKVSELTLIAPFAPGGAAQPSAVETSAATNSAALKSSGGLRAVVSTRAPASRSAATTAAPTPFVPRSPARACPQVRDSRS